MNGKRVSINNPRDAINAGIGYIPVDRRSDGLAFDMSVRDNINLHVLNKLKKGLFLSPRLENKNAQYWIKENKIKTPSFNTITANLSGGNQQKVILSKWLSSDLNILIADHITRGIDVGAKDEIYEQIEREFETISTKNAWWLDPVIEEDLKELGIKNGKYKYI